MVLMGSLKHRLQCQANTMLYAGLIGSTWACADVGCRQPVNQGWVSQHHTCTALPACLFQVYFASTDAEVVSHEGVHAVTVVLCVLRQTVPTPASSGMAPQFLKALPLF